MDQLSGAGDHQEFQAAFPDDDRRSTTTNIGGSDHAAVGTSFMFPPPAAASSSGVLPWPPPPLLPAIMENLNAVPAASGHFSGSMLLRDQERFFPPPLPPLPPPPPPAFYHDLYARRAAGLQFAYDGSGAVLGSSSSDPLGLAAGLYMGGGGAGRAAMAAAMYPSSPFELGKMTPQEIMDAKALAASKSHSEAERRRRERINAHLARLRSLLPSTTKTDKASLLAEVIQHVKELKRQTSEIAEESPLPTETDELTVDAACDADGRFLVRASLCCDDRSDLLPDLIRALKALRLRTLKAEITTLGGRIKNVLVITAEDGAADDQYQQLAPEQAVASIQDALKEVMERPAVAAAADEPASSAAAGGGGIKRQRTATLSDGAVLEHRSI